MQYNKEADTIAVDANIPGYITSSPSPRYPLETLQMIEYSRRWWKLMKDSKLFISETAWAQISKGDGHHVQKRKELASGMKRLKDKEGVDDIVEALENSKIFSKENLEDAQILANACVHDMDYLVTYNMRHLANEHKIPAIKAVIKAEGYFSPIIITPKDFLIDILGVTDFATF